MNQVLHIYNIPISYSITTHGVHIIYDMPLHQLMQQAPSSGIAQLSAKAKADFEIVNQRTLNISENSLTLEIWGHYYFEKCFNRVSWLLPSFIFKKLIERVEKSMQEFDCAEWPIDRNRWIWDILSWFKPAFDLIVKDKF